MAEALLVDCPKEGKKVPVWHCLGILTQQRELCPYLARAVIYGSKSAEVECKWNKKKE